MTGLFQSAQGTLRSSLDLVRRTNAVLNRKERLAFLKLCVLAVIQAMAQLLSLGSVMPFAMALSDPEKVKGHSIYQWAIEWFPWVDGINVALATGILVFGAVLLTSSLAVVTTWMQFRLAKLVQTRLAMLLLNDQLAVPYEQFIQANSAEILSRLNQSLPQFISGVILQFSVLTTELIQVCSILIALLIPEPGLAISMALCLGLGYGVSFWLIRKQILHYGWVRLDSERKKNGLIQEICGSFRELVVYGRSGQYLSRYRTETERYIEADFRKSIYKVLPEQVIQVLTFMALLGMVGYLLTAKGSLDAAIPLLAFFGYASRQLVPSLGKVFNSVNGFINVMPQANDVLQALAPASKQSKDDSSEVETTELHDAGTEVQSIELQGLTYTYPGQEVAGIRNISVKIPGRSTTAFVGQTGAGKSTLLGVLLGLLNQQDGKILINGEALDDGLLPWWRSRLGFVPQEVFLSDASIAANIAFGVAPEDLDMDQVCKVARLANIHEFISERAPEGYETVIGERGIRLSGGQRQRIGIARALYHEPSVLILDEATSALDNATENAIIESVRSLAESHTIIQVAHRLSTVMMADTVHVLSEGRIEASGTFEELEKNSPDFRKVAGLVA